MKAGDRDFTVMRIIIEGKEKNQDIIYKIFPIL